MHPRFTTHFALAFLLVPVGALAQNASFVLQTGGKTIGKDTYSVSRAKNGYKLSSRYSYHIAGNESSGSDDFKFGEDYGYLEGATNNLATQSLISYNANKARTELTIGINQAGIQDSRHLAIRPSFVLMPAFDAGAAQIVLLHALTHPTPDNLYNIVVPGTGAKPSQGGGSEDPSAAAQQAGNNAYDALWAKAADTTGTLDGKPVPVHTYTLTAGKNTWTFYADDANNLLQCDVSMLHGNYVRSKFELSAPAQP